MKLALGTVQFGTNYGAFNKGGQVSSEVVAQVLDLAQVAGVETLDTARGYGTSEQVLGSIAGSRFSIVTKCPPITDPTDVFKSFAASEATLRGPVYGYLLHNAQDLLGSNADRNWLALEQLRSLGRVERIGVSAYSLDEVQAVLARYPITLVQLPANVLTPWFTSIKLPKTLEVHVRSVFLQGFLLGSPDELPERLKPWRATLEIFRARAAALKLTPLQAALAPLIQSDAIHKVVIGIDNVAQLTEILEAIQTLDPSQGFDLGAFSEVTAELTDPRTW